MHKMRFFALIAMSLPQSVALVAQTATPTPRAAVADPARDARAPVASINAARFRVDTSRVYAVGHSMGGFMAVMAAARTRDLKGLVYLSGWDIGSEAATWRGAPAAAVVADYRESATRVQGATGDALVAEMLAHEQEWSLSTVAPRVADRPILVTAARHENEDNPPAIKSRPARPCAPFGRRETSRDAVVRHGSRVLGHADRVGERGGPVAESCRCGSGHRAARR